MKRLFIPFFVLFTLCWLGGYAQRDAETKPSINRDRADTVVKPKVRQTPATPTGGRKGGSRIVDDSTKMVYGPKTTRWTTERNIFTMRENYRPLDTLFSNYHRWTYFHKFNYFYQDLGNNGTALNPIFPTFASDNIGVDPGFSAFGYYYADQEPVYYDTKSPYTRMQLIWGGQGRAMTKVEYSRNINPRWNFGFNYRPILTNKQIQKRGKSDYQVVSHYYDLYTHFKSKDSSYSVLASYRRIRHRVNENGGVVPLFRANVVVDSLTFEQAYPGYFQPNASPVLVAASSYEQRNQFHLLQQYAVTKAVQFYHIGDLYRQRNWYKDDLSTETRPFYDTQRIDTVPGKMVDSTRYSYLQNQVGFKGRLMNGKLFFNGYYKIKSYNLFYKYLNVDTLALSRHSDEHYGGGQLSYAIDSLQEVSVSAELLEGGYQKLIAAGQTKWIDFDVQKRISKPAFLPTAYSGHFDFWSNEFKPVETELVKVFPKVTLGPVFVSPGVTYSSFRNYIYFAKRDTFPGTTQRVLPLQSRKKIEWITPEIRMDVRLPLNIHIRPQVLYSRILADPDSALTIPKIFINTQIAIERSLFNGNLLMQAGVDLHWHSSYTPMGYDPAIQHYFVQHDVTTPSYLLTDVFFNGKIKRGRFFIKWHNVLQQFNPLNGHMPTPYYRGMRNIIDFGFDILMFD